jgi:hypothetical protein
MRPAHDEENAMPKYIVNKQPQSTGEHEVHDSTCNYLPSSWNQHSLGWQAGCTEAVRAAKQIYPTADGCYWCSRPCHKR